jgi:hypothetical protein
MREGMRWNTRTSGQAADGLLIEPHPLSNLTLVSSFPSVVEATGVGSRFLNVK